MKKKMRQLLIGLLILVMGSMLMTGCGSTKETAKEATKEVKKNTATTDEKVELIISAAASLTDVTAEITKRYKEVAPNVTLTFTYGASGALQTQIEEGAPTDIFMSAAQKQMTALVEGGYIQEDTKVDLLRNKLVLIVPKTSTLGISSFLDLATDKATRIALGDPASVPVGQYSESVFTKLGILDAVKAKANYGTDVRQVLTWVETGESDCGVVYATDAKISKDVSVICEAPEDAAEPVIYPVAALKSTKNLEEAKAFIKYLQTEDVLKLFETYGFERAN